MASLRWKIFIIFIVVGILVADCDARKKKNSKRNRAEKKRLEKLRILQKRETNPVNFSRLVVMRLIYGVASMMGIQDRLGGVLNGAFVPPGADEDDYGGFDDYSDDGDEGGFGLGGGDEGGFDLGGIFGGDE